MAEQSLHVQKAFPETGPDQFVQPEVSTPEGQVWIDFLHGDDKALASLYHQYANKLFNYGRQFTTKNTEAPVVSTNNNWITIDASFYQHAILSAFIPMTL